MPVNQNEKLRLEYDADFSCLTDLHLVGKLSDGLLLTGIRKR